MENAALPHNVNNSSLTFGARIFDQPYFISDEPSVPVSVELELAAASLTEHGRSNVLNGINSLESSHCKRSWHWERASAFGTSPAGTSQEAANLANYDPFVAFNFNPRGSTNDRDSGGHESLRMEKSASEDNILDNTELLTLKLFGNGYTHEEEERNSSPYSKRCKVLFPQGQHPRCQVDGCLADLINAKDYHKRHKVCELHAKADKAFIAHSMQRFCQQCSRFHPLEEFDENKRSCRRRLAGHNKRRRRAHPVTATNLQNEDPFMNLLRLLTNFQGSSDSSELNRILSGTSELLQFLATANSSVASLNDKPIDTGKCRTGPHDLNEELISKMVGRREISSKQPERNLPHVSAAITPRDIHDKQEQQFSQYSLPVSSRQLGSRASTLPSNTTEPFLARKEVLLESDLGRTNPEQTFYWPLSEACNQHLKHEKMPRDKCNHNSAGKIPVGNETSAVFNSDGYQCRRDLSSYYRSFDLRNLRPQVTNANSEVPPNYERHMNPDSTEWTDRIVFKLFDRKPGELPLMLQKQILEWLAHCPSNMESYIRPGCVILTIFLSMTASAWERLSTEIKDSLERLINIADSEFWHRGRILVQIRQQIGFIAEGNVYVHNLFDAFRIPELTFIRPIAVVMGEGIELLVKGRNLKASHARIICNYRGSHAVKDFAFDTDKREDGVGHKLNKDDVNEEETLMLQVGPFHGPGRCFIEVEQSGIGGAFPIIVADSAICEEICMLQSEFKDTSRRRGSSEGTESMIMPEVIHFLHEFGWLLESEWQMCRLAENVHFSGDFSSSRFRWLFIFAVEHNCCSVTLKLLDCLFSLGTQSKEAILEKAMETISSEVFLLHRAVKVNSSRMVKLLLDYSPPYLVCQTSRRIFTPDSPGPGGLTPLHVAACMKNAVEVIDALTEGPLHVWFAVWASSRDDNGHTPLSYALASGNQSYIHFVQNKHSRLNVLDGQSENVTIPAYTSPDVDIESNISTSRIITETGRVGAERPINQNLVSNKLTSNKLPCSSCAFRDPFTLASPHGIGGIRISMYRPFVLSLVAIAAVCVCVCILLKGPPEVMYVRSPFLWDSVKFGSY